MMRILALLAAIVIFPVAYLKADLKYIVYDLETHEVSSYPTDPATAINGDYFGSKMLFVSNGTDYYMGVFEVTREQARLLKWTSSVVKGEEKYAFVTTDTTGTNPFPIDHETFTTLFVPTVEQWQTYANADKVPYANAYGTTFYGGYSNDIHAYRPGADVTAYVANAHGVYDIFGNAAEYTTSGKYYGGSPHSTLRYKDFTIEWARDPTKATDLDEDGYSFRGVRLVYVPPAAQTYSVSVTVNGTEVDSKEDVSPGETVSYTVTAPDGYELVAGAPTVTPDTVQLNGTTFVMPESNVTIAYTAKKYVDVTVEGGSPSQVRLVEGETVTIKPTQPVPPYCFVKWESLPEGWGGTAETAEQTLTVPNTIEAGSAVTIKATYQTYPRVLVYGSTVSVEKGEALGNGYYTPGSRLRLQANTVPYYNFVKWAITGKEETETTYAGVTVGTYGTEVTYTAVYEAQEDTSTPVNTLVTRIGEVSATEGTYATRTPLGYRAENVTETTLNGNVFMHYGATQVTSDYVALDLSSGGVAYPTVSVSSPESVNTVEAYKTSTILLKRTTWDGETYYVGVYETTNAHVEYLKEENEQSETLLKNTYPYVDWDPANVDINVTITPDFFAKVKALFEAHEVEPMLPSKAQLVGIRLARATAEDKANTLWCETGAGHLNRFNNHGDFKITEEMIVYNRGETDGPAVVGSKTIDPYGFYDLWGNCCERLVEPGGWGGWYGLGNNGYVECNLENANFLPRKALTFRPAIEVLPQVEVKIEGIEGSFKVIEGQTIALQPQVLKAHLFTGWTASTTIQPEEDAETGAYIYEVTEAVTLKPNFEPASETLALTCDGCTGPTEVYPGQTTLIYLDPEKTFRELTVDAPSAVTIGEASDGAIPVTFANPAVVKSVTITAVYEGGAPGYRFRVQ